MAKFIAAENAEVWWVPAVASAGAMTVVEGDAGTRLSAQLQGGVVIDFSTNFVDSGDLTSAFDSQVAGTYGGTLTLSSIMYEDDSVAVYNTLPRGSAGFVVVSIAGTANQTGASWATGDVYDLYAVTIGSRTPPSLDRADLVTYDVECAITSAPTSQGTAA